MKDIEWMSWLSDELFYVEGKVLVAVHKTLK